MHSHWLTTYLVVARYTHLMCNIVVDDIQSLGMMLVVLGKQLEGNGAMHMVDAYYGCGSWACAPIGDMWLLGR